MILKKSFENPPSSPPCLSLSLPIIANQYNGQPLNRQAKRLQKSPTTVLSAISLASQTHLNITAQTVFHLFDLSLASKTKPTVMSSPLKAATSSLKQPSSNFLLLTATIILLRHCQCNCQSNPDRGPSLSS